MSTESVDKLSVEMTQPLDSQVTNLPSATTNVILCAGCQEESLGSRRFCGNCGVQLWDPCLDCKEKNPVDIKFCGNCGTDCQAAVKLALQTLVATLEAADNFAASGRYLDALGKLEQLSLTDHSQLLELNAQVSERLQRFPYERQKYIDKSAQVFNVATSLIQESRLDEAYQQLTSIPEAFRGQDVNSLFAELESKRNEASHLRQFIKQALAKRDYQDLLPKVQRLAELEPHNQKLQKLQTQLQQRQDQQHRKDSNHLLKTAEAALAKCNYEQAQAALQQLPNLNEEDEVFNKTVLAMKECVWLAEYLRTAPLVMPSLKVVADRLLKLQPHDKQSAKLAEQMKARWQAAERKNSGKAIPWSKVADKTKLDMPVSLAEIPAELLTAQQGKQSSSQAMLVAYGLALQGLGRAKISLDLAPQEKKSGWGKRLFGRAGEKLPTSAWGIDCGAKYLKAIQLRVNEANDQIEIVQSVVMRHQGKAEGALDTARDELETWQRFFQKYPMAGETVALNINSTKTLGRFFDIPAPKPEKFFEAVAFELRSRIPLEEARLYYDYHWSELPSKDEQLASQRRVVLVAAERQIVRQRLDRFADAGAKRLIMQSDCVALCNALYHIQQLSDDESIALVEIGSKTSSFVVLSGETFWFHGLYQGTDTLDKALSTELKKTQRDAEALRLQPAKARALHVLDEILQPEFAKLLEELQITIHRYQNETGKPINKLLVTGAGSQQIGLLNYLCSA